MSKAGDRTSLEELIRKVNGANIDKLRKGARILKEMESLRNAIGYRADETPEPSRRMRFCRFCCCGAAFMVVVSSFGHPFSSRQLCFFLASALILGRVLWQDREKRKRLGKEAEARREKETEGTRNRLSLLEKTFEENYGILPPKYQNSAAYQCVAGILAEGRAFSLSDALEVLRREGEKIDAMMKTIKLNDRIYDNSVPDGLYDDVF